MKNNALFKHLLVLSTLIALFPITAHSATIAQIGTKELVDNSELIFQVSLYLFSRN